MIIYYVDDNDQMRAGELPVDTIEQARKVSHPRAALSPGDAIGIWEEASKKRVRDTADHLRRAWVTAICMAFAVALLSACDNNSTPKPKATPTPIVAPAPTPH